jgi:uncharacterized protein (TIGR03067 family)
MGYKAGSLEVTVMISCLTMAMMLASLAHELSQLQGHWKALPVSEQYGTFYQAVTFLKPELIIDGTAAKSRVALGDRLWQETSFSFTLYPWQHPKGIDLIVHEPSGRKTLMPCGKGIYRIEGDRLTVNLGYVRPAQFANTVSMNSSFCVFKRQKK